MEQVLYSAVQRSLQAQSSKLRVRNLLNRRADLAYDFLSHYDVCSKTNTITWQCERFDNGGWYGSGNRGTYTEMWRGPSHSFNLVIYIR